MALDIADLLARYQTLKDHDNTIMARRPEGQSRASWRMDNPAPIRSFFRVYEDKKQRQAHINYDTAPVLEIWTLAGRPKLVERIDLREPKDALAKYDLPAPHDMTNTEFAAIRAKLGLTQAQLAPVLDYKLARNISDLERASNPKRIPKHIARLMRAYEAGYRPSDWPA